MAAKNSKTTAAQLEKKIRGAMDELSKEGKRPTYAHVRDVIGGGSFRDLGPIIKAILAEQEARAKAESAVPDMPADVAELAAAIWEGAYRCADEVAGADRRTHAEELKRLREEIAEREGDIAAVEDALDAMTARAEAAEEAQSQLEETIVDLRVVIAGLEGRLLGRAEVTLEVGEEQKDDAPKADDPRQFTLLDRLEADAENTASARDNDLKADDTDAGSDFGGDEGHEAA